MRNLKCVNVFLYCKYSYSAGANMNYVTSLTYYTIVGNRRNSHTWDYDTAGDNFLFDRGYTGHEHLDDFAIINMNGRIYDPLTGRMMAPDNYVQSSLSQNLNRYSYCLNNPMIYTDPSGDFITLAAAWLFFTESGYEVQKYISPVAVKVDWSFGTHENKLGFDVSYGVPKFLPYSYRENYGKTYYWKHISSDYRGWETRRGYEHSIIGLYHWGATKYEAGKFSQTVGFKKIGIPSNIGLDMYNDLWGDKGDRFETSRTVLNIFPGYSLENRLYTGDPGLNREDRYKNKYKGPNGTYIKDPDNPYAPDPNAYRAGILALRIGPLSIGLDSEPIRDLFQNKLVHKIGGHPYFEDLSKNPDYPEYHGWHFYFQFGW